MPPRAFTIAAAALSSLALTGCEPSTEVPVDAQLVHVVVIESRVRVEPASVRSGDVYLVLEEPTSQVLFVQRKASAAETPGPLRQMICAESALATRSSRPSRASR
jgi:hypothetical protein